MGKLQLTPGIMQQCDALLPKNFRQPKVEVLKMWFNGSGSGSRAAVECSSWLQIAGSSCLKRYAVQAEASNAHAPACTWTFVVGKGLPVARR